MSIQPVVPAVPGDIVTRPCIHVDKDDQTDYTVAGYDAVQRQRRLQPLWARVVVSVEELTETPASPYKVRITDLEAYNAQMRRLLGLE